MTDIEDIQIKKKTFQFEVKRRYQYIGHFKVRTRQPIDILKDNLKAVFSPKKQDKRKEAKKEEMAPKPSFNFTVMAAGIIVALLIVLMGWFYLVSQFSDRPSVFTPQLEKPSLDASVSDGDVITSGELRDSKHVAAVTTSLLLSNSENYSIELTTYDEVLPTQVFVLNSDRVAASTYPVFLRELRNTLSKKNIILNDISVDQLENIPSGAIVVVPSGVIPKQLVGVNSSTNFNDLVNKGVVLVYIGQPFSKMLDGNLVVSTPASVNDQLRFISFNENAPLEATDDISLFQPLYQVTAKGAGWETQLLYNSISVIKRGNGAIIFIPQTLEGGWRGDGKLAAHDVSRFIFDYPWLTPSSTTKRYVDSSSEGNVSLDVILFTNPFDSNNCSVKIDVSAYSPASNYPLEQTVIAYAKKKSRGELFIQEGYQVVPTNISNTQVRMNARLMEPAPAQPNMFLVIHDNLDNEIERFPRGPINVQQPDVPFDVPIYADKGEYTVSLVDDLGKSYARTYMKVVSVDIREVKVRNQKNSEYVFDILMGGSPALLDSVTVSVDGGNYGKYTFRDASRVSIDVGKYTYNDYLPFGKHTFEFTAGGFTKTITVQRDIPKNPLMDPLFLGVIVLAGGIAFIGVYLARSEVINYSIDVPDFPPMARTKIPLSSDVILSIFHKVNENYRWKFTPLTISELRNGFKDMFYKGNPIYVTDYNVEYLLDELIKKGLAVSSLDYYCPVSWVKQSGRDIKYLSFMRKLRDICVNNAVPFTGLGESKTADSEIKVADQSMFVHFYTSSESAVLVMKHALYTVKEGITIVLFKNQYEKSEFKSMLNSGNVGPLILKLESDGGSVMLHTLDEFNDMIIEVKGL